MRNYRKLLLAGLAIIPLALSSWTSEDNGTVYNKSEYNNSSFKEINGKKDAISFLATDINSKFDTKKYFENVEFISETVVKTLEPSLTIDKIVKDYK